MKFKMKKVPMYFSTYQKLLTLSLFPDSYRCWRTLALDLFMSYLSNRAQRVIINDAFPCLRKRALLI